MSYQPPYTRNAREPVAGTRDYARALQSGELFRAWNGEHIGRTLDPIVEDITQSQMSLHRVLARAAGLPEGLTAGEVYARMIGTGDLAAMIVPGRVELIQSQFSPWVARYTRLFRRVPVQNFRDVTFHSLGVSSPVSMTEFAEFKFGSVSTPSPLETIGLMSNGIAWLLSRHVLVNGDTALMAAMESQIAAVFAAYLRTALATALEATDTLEDGNQYFYAGAGNLVSTGSGGAPSITTLDAATNLMAQQTLPGGQRCGLVPRYLVVPSTLAATAAVLARAVYEDNSPTPFEIVVLPELGGSYCYYVADPALSPALCLLTLGNSDRLLNVETYRPQITVDGIAMRATMDFRIARASRCGIVRYAVA